jgi:hypothetical protein
MENIHSKLDYGWQVNLFAVIHYLPKEKK